ncbi:transglycosylase domain-containing protein [Alloiococcus sp. CFN-8]|uniref:transglycosylase domain-containing protein n=1 Tax=Alloiococcus sp. CFN-8 TaxID=3416081 RepID=UPI003CEE4989
MFKKAIKKIIALMLLIALLIGLFFTAKGYILYKTSISKIPIAEIVQEITDKDSYTAIDDMPDIYLEAVVEVEDKRFYSHTGVDPIAIVRALYNDIKAMSFVEGGSTITQQLAKNLYFSQEKKIERKVAEVFMALAMEDKYDKDEILELYVNSIYFGDNYYSIGEASRGYFNKEAEALTPYESTLLAGIPNAPSVYSPSEDSKLSQERHKQVLDRLVEGNKLTQEEAELIFQNKKSAGGETND